MNGMEWNMEWNGMKWNRIEWNRIIGRIYINGFTPRILPEIR
jgi:hypothetical protein